MLTNYSLESHLIVHLDHGAFILYLSSIELVFDLIIFADRVFHIVY